MIDYTKDVLFIQDYMFNASIIEYDIRAAGYNILIAANALTQQQIEELGQVTKDTRNIRIGLMIRDDPKLQEILSAGYTRARKTFIEQNQLKEEDIICIKKDAIFTSRRCKILEFDDPKMSGIVFRQKTRWRSYLRLGNIEFLFMDLNRWQINYLGESGIEYHRDYWIKTILEIINKISNADRSVKSYTMNLVARYKAGTLHERYYHPFKSNGSGNDPLYNYQNVIVPLIQVMVRAIQ